MLQSLPPNFATNAMAAALIATVAGLSRGFSGFGAALIFIPLASAIMGPVLATAVLLIVDFIVSCPLQPDALRRCGWAELKRVSIGALIGFMVGIQVLTTADPVVVRWLTSFLVLCALAVLASGWRYHGPQSTALTTGVGLVSGAMSGLAQVGGAAIVVFWLGTNVAIDRLRANLIIYFQVLTALGLVVFAWKGLLTAESWWISAAALPCYALGVWSGRQMYGYATETTFRRIAFLLVALSAITGMPLLDSLLGRR